MITIKWEPINQPSMGGYMGRAAIPGGWLVRLTTDVYTFVNDDRNMEQGHEWRESICFVPDPEHKWQDAGSELKKPI